MHDNLYQEIELAPDLEWLLLRDQENIQDLLQHLVDEYGAGLSILMQVVFGNTARAKEGLVETLALIVLQRSHFRSNQPVKLWLYSLALDTAWRTRRHWNRSGYAPGLEDEDALQKICFPINPPDWLECLPEQTRLAVVLNHYLGLKTEEVAKVLQISINNIQRELEIVDQVFQALVADKKVELESEQRQQLMRLTSRRLSRQQNHRRLRRIVQEMSWAIGAIFLVGFFTRIYDIRNPDPTRQAIEVPFLTPLPTSTGVPKPTPTTKPILTLDSTSDDIALRYWQRSLNFDSVWEDTLVILGGAQAGPIGHTVKRVEFGWDVRSRRMMLLVGPPDGPPENGLYADEDEYYELDIQNGTLAGYSILDKTKPKEWYYIGWLPFNLQFNNFDGNFWYRAMGGARAAGRDALLVEVMNPDHYPEVYAWLDSTTAIPLRQQRFAEQHYKVDSLVLDVIVNQIDVNVSFKEDYFNIEVSRPLGFKGIQERWWTNSTVEASLRRMEENSVEKQKNNPDSKSQESLYYQVKEISNQEGIKYSTSVFRDREFIGEYPMGNPWSVKCERSPDGKLVAFIEDRRFEFGTVIPSHVLHWFSLDHPEVLQTPLSDVDATRFAFSPDSQFLAVHASNKVSLINLVSGNIDTLLVQPIVDSLVFSEDGKYLGVMRNTYQVDGTTSTWIINLKTKEVNTTALSNPEQIFEQQNANLENIKIDFSKPVKFGLDNCR